MANKREQPCFNRAKAFLFQNNNGMTIDTIQEEDISKWGLFVWNDNSYSHSYGITPCDREKLIHLFCGCTRNPKTDAFPDFINVRHGFVEHFEITSSETTTKGSQQKIENAASNRKIKKAIEQLTPVLDNAPCGSIVENGFGYTYKNRSYDNLAYAFKKIWEKHIDHCVKYRGNKETGVFLIDYNEIAIVEHPDYGIRTCAGYGDLLPREKDSCYKLSRDKDLLDYIYQYKDSIHFVIFEAGPDYTEIISTAQIPEIKKLLPYQMEYTARSMMEINKIYGWKCPTYNNELNLAADTNEKQKT